MKQSLTTLFVVILSIFHSTYGFSQADDVGALYAHGIWGVGLEVGFAEYGAMKGDNPNFLAGKLGFAIDLAKASGCIPTEGLEDLKDKMARASDSRSLYREIEAYRKKLAFLVRINCSCGGPLSSLEQPGNDFPETNISGFWVVTTTDETFHYTYKNCWEIIPSGNKNWTVQQTLLDTQHPHHRTKIGQRGHDYSLTEIRPGVFELFGSGNDTNPSAAGYFEQNGTISFTGGVVSGNGKHKGQNIEASLSFDGNASSSPCLFEDQIAGSWSVTTKDMTYHYDYKYRWDIIETGNKKWRVEQTLLDTNHSFHKNQIGQRGHDYSLTEIRPGVYEIFATGNDSNPSSAGYFEQKGTIKISDGKITGEALHKGTLTVNLSFSGNRN